MAEFCAYRSLRRDPFPGGKDTLTKSLLGAFTKGNNTHTFIPAALHAFLLVPAHATPSNNKLFQQFIKAYLENQNQNQNQN